MISLICTVKNERGTLPLWISSITKQTREPDEIVIVDGGSTDGTWEWLQNLPSTVPTARVFQDPGNIAHGRNVAIEKARGPIIVVTDAGCTYDPSWFAKITAPFQIESACCVATGFGPGIVEADSALTCAVASTTTPAPAEFQRDWLPSSRSVAFTKELWHAVGGYPQWIPYCEDVLFDQKIKEKSAIIFIREPLVFWRPRATFAGFLRQLYNYTRSEAHGSLNTTRQLIRYVSLVVGFYLLLTIAKHPFHLGVLALLVVIYCIKFWRRGAVFAPVSKKFFTLLLIPFVVLAGDAAKMTGWPVGLYERMVGTIKKPTL